MKNTYILYFLALGLMFTQCQSDNSNKEANVDVEDPLKVETETQNNGNVTQLSPEEAANLGLNDESTVEIDPSLPLTTIQFEEESHDFGDIKDGDIAKHTFKFKNTGKNPLIIQNAKGSCGCTVPKFTDEPIPPGGEGEIKVEFDSKNKPGPNNKTVTVTTNTEQGTHLLTVKSNVIQEATAE